MKRLMLLLCSVAAVCISCGDDKSGDTGAQNTPSGGTSCDAPKTLCGDHCVSLADLHWSSCGVCTSDYQDKDGSADNGCEAKKESIPQTGCEGSLIKCGDDCVDLLALHWSVCGSCASGYEDQDGDASNGCEFKSNSEPIVTCSGTQVKCGESCVVLADMHWSGCGVCTADYEDADGNAANGCESKRPVVCDAPLTNCDDVCVELDAMHWSACGVCVVGYEDKDGNRANGCESVIYECPAGQVVCAGGCTDLSQNHWASCGVCIQGYADSDCDASNGCEAKQESPDCEAGYVKCGEDCVDLAAGHWASCGVCLDGYADEDAQPGNGCEALACAGGQVRCGNTCVDLNQKHWNSCDTCRGGYEDTDGNAANGCENKVMQPGACYEVADCQTLSHVASVSCDGGFCRISACAEGYADCDGDAVTGCEVVSARDYYHCGAVGACTGADAGSECKLGEQCASGVCKPVPEIIGCSDGTREGFIDLMRFNNLAACGGAWTVRGIHHNIPACGRQSGNTGSNRDGNGCNLEDLCAEGWHVCLGRGDVMTRSDYGCDGILDGVNQNEPALFITRTSSRGSLLCDPDTVGVPLNMNDIFGCGNFGCFATGNDCDPLKLSSHNLCSALRQSCGCSKQGDGSVTCSDNSGACYGNNIGHSIDYFSALNGKSYSPAWDCSSDLPDSGAGEQEARDILKSQPDSQGGVMCCKDQCQADADCGVGLICRYHVCVECIRKEDGSYEGCPTGKTCTQQHTCE